MISDTKTSLPILYSFRRCPYAMRARLALAFTGQSYELREIMLRDKPAEMLALSPKGTVPVLQLPDGSCLEESSEIVLWALGKNLPTDWRLLSKEQQNKADALLVDFQSAFIDQVTRYKYFERYGLENGKEPQQKAVHFLRLLNEMLRENTFLCGATPACVDLLIFPFVRQFRVVDREWFDAHIDLPYVRRWFDFFQGHFLFKKIMEKHQPWLETRQHSPDPLYIHFS